MSTLEKYLSGLVGLALVTTLVLPGRQTASVIGAAGSFVSKTLATASGQKAA